MSNILTILIMCVIGYLAFIVFAETARVRLRPTSRRLRERQLRGQWVGGLVAFSAIAAFFVDGGLVDKLKPSLLLAAFATLLVAFLLNFKPFRFTERLKERWDRMIYGDLHPNRQTQPALPTLPATTDLSSAQAPNVTTIDSDIEPHTQREANKVEHPLADVTIEPPSTQDAPPYADIDLVDQIQHVDAIKPDIAGDFPATGFIQSERPIAANNGSFGNSVAASPDEIVVDDFFEEVDGQSIADEPFINLPPELLDVEDEIEFTQAAIDDTVESPPQTEPEVTEALASEPAEFFYAEEQIDDHVSGEEIPEPGPDATELDKLAFAMQSVNGDAVKLQRSVAKINELNQREQYYRTELHGARLAFEKAQEAQFEVQANEMNSELKLGKKKLQAEQSNRINLEANLEAKRRALLQTETRVAELENDLKARQQVFHDQMESLEKTKEMARNAALLARRAATMQQQARNTAMEERAARERLEVSAKKAVYIARNAISKLAEEERKNHSTRKLH